MRGGGENNDKVFHVILDIVIINVRMKLYHNQSINENIALTAFQNSPTTLTFALKH